MAADVVVDENHPPPVITGVILAGTEGLNLFHYGRSANEAVKGLLHNQQLFHSTDISAVRPYIAQQFQNANPEFFY